MEQEKHISCYCGQEAHFQFKNGKWCCHETMNLCPQIKKIRSEASKKLWSIRKENGTNSASSELKDFGLTSELDARLKTSHLPNASTSRAWSVYDRPHLEDRISKGVNFRCFGGIVKKDF